MKTLSLLALTTLAMTGLTSGAAEAGPAARKTYNLRMVIAHDPAPRYYLQALQRFADTVEKETHGGVHVQLLNTSAYGTIDDSSIVENVAGGKVEMAATTVSKLGHIEHDFWAFEMPYAFDSYTHVARAIDGSFGRSLMSTLPKHNLRGLAFTYSGGYKVVCSNRALRTPADFGGITMLTHDPVNFATFHELGSHVKHGGYRTASQELSSGRVQAADMTYTRITENGVRTRYVNELEHSVFLTTLIINDKFFSSLPKQYQASICKVAQDVALEERAATLRETDKIREQLRVRGVKVVRLSPAEKAKLRSALRPVYQSLARLFSPGLLQQMQACAAGTPLSSR